ncbi:MAG: hypothetical protein MJ082_05375 [Clostridia bacterium]|nr:hypothetical protein [Clostridia bacterium]
MGNEQKTSLEKSHSKVSNFKLTLLCLLGAIGYAALFFGIAWLVAGVKVAIVPLAVGAVLSVLSLIALRKFVR